MTPDAPTAARLDRARADVDRARADVDTATRRAREARIAAAGPLRERARRRSRLFRIVVLAAAIIAGLLMVARIVLGVLVGTSEAAAGTREQVLDDAAAAVTALLTSDPAHAGAYADRALSVTAGAMHDRLVSSRAALVEAITAQPAGSTGQILSAGLLTDPTGDEPGATARVLLVADATNPALVGAGRTDTAGDGRLTLAVTMTRTESGWRISQAVQS